ncbi:MAG: hypothetical protein IJS03_07665 [Eubacterium sp.]|nr:hypothetical protein [Eubacterium sp.]
MKTNKKSLIILCVALFVSAVVLVSAILWLIPNAKYRNATELEKSGRFEDAVVLFESLNGFKDSEEKCLQLTEKINDEKYNKALTLVSEDNFDEAKAVFTDLGEYKDSKKQAENCDVLKSKYEKYNEALSLIETEKYTEAKALFSEIKDYKDSEKQIKNCDSFIKNEKTYKKAKNALKNDEFNEAIDALKKLKDYKDSEKLLKKAEKEKSEWGTIEKITMYSFGVFSEEDGFSGNLFELTPVENASGYQVRGDWGSGVKTKYYLTYRTSNSKFCYGGHDGPSGFCFRAYKKLSDGEIIYGKWVSVKFSDSIKKSDMPYSKWNGVVKDYNDFSMELWDSVEIISY